jgi:transglutaminase-like putative cysteine protease
MTTRRRFLQTAVSTTALGAPLAALSQHQQQRTFAPQPGPWRTFEVTTRVEAAQPQGAMRLWLPVPSVNTEWQQSLESSFTSNGRARFATDAREGTRMLQAEFDVVTANPYLELTSRVQTRDRAVDWRQRGRKVREDTATLAYYTRPTELIPTDGIVRRTAMQATRGAHTDVEKVRRIYDWVVTNTWREPKVRGCGEGDIRTLLETGDLGGKCADLNALFVGLCRAVGIPARDVYGLRLAPSAFGYRELGANPASLKGAQHCRAEVFLQAHGWVAMDPADVAKVMRQETGEWIKSTAHAVVAPVHRGLFGAWEGNWVAWNTAHDLALPGAKGAKLGFFMYPIGEDAQGRLDSYAPDEFKYQITARELKA